MSGLADPVVVAALVPFRLVVLGASAGGLAPLRDVLSGLPADFPIPIVVVHHLGADLRSRLPEVLNFRSQLPCRWVVSGELPRSGTVLVAPAGANLVLQMDGRLEVVPGPKPRLGWPSVDLFLTSVASVLGRHAIGVILSGMMWDGAAGIAALRRAGGATLVQHPRSAAFPDMPSAAVDLGRADLMMPPHQIALALQILAEAGVH
ncbi:chemotaxis protein CheB [Roseococcus sp. SYP-B2431]|uniref:chemotaxis protein CheB n=1 Tax=Roseococcus sp. SYP-B2431 TaxID=2496640 RepID=UPI0013F3F950|nr:chemotaxis protein CheB [Roseococcus sp. SYP-B2431]